MRALLNQRLKSSHKYPVVDPELILFLFNLLSFRINVLTRFVDFLLFLDEILR